MFSVAMIGVLALVLAACGGTSSSDKTATARAGAGGPTAVASAAATGGASPAANATRASGQLILATTTSTQDSGLLDVLVPMFERESGYSVKTVAVGSGQAIEQGSRGDADVLLVHSPAAEQQMVDAGNGIERTLIMHNDFIFVGPPDDPAALKASTSSADAMKRIAGAQAPFISRGDNSGTNALELKLWQAAAITPKGQSWYQESGQGMGATLAIADQKSAYTISDRATYLAQKKNLSLTISYERDKGLLNVYHVIVVNPAKFPKVNVVGARAFAAFLVRADIQDVIGKFGVDKAGEPLFFADAGKPEPAQ
ncbi:MAG: substrate-binding domain-containing protein [Chloroflexi bacterium]|nr:substrate-binding domain-containing protein [Chloroflexota bacterium]